MVSSGTGCRRFTPLAFTRVRIEDEFWAPRMAVNRTVTLAHQLAQIKETGRLENFARAGGAREGAFEGIYFNDSDVFKWVEAAAYALATQPDPALEAELDDAIALFTAAQEADGYLNTYYRLVEPEKKWSNLRDMHELYCAGHLIEGAVAHFQATGKRSLLDVACRYADLIGRIFGTGPGQKRGYCGHEEIELALVKLYHATGEARYLRLAQYFVDERGRQPYYFDVEAQARGEDPKSYWARSYDYCQAHKPVRELAEVGGHAVRAMYLYSAMADLAGETGDDGLRRAGERLWEHLTLKRMYLTGGIGPSRHNEGFTADYDLPNETAYAETCAAIGLVFWAHRLLQLEGDGRYADIMERALYNGVLSGVSLDGAKFFYENPLASAGTHHRREWFGCACCPPNIARLLASLGGYAYSTSEDGAAVHLYIQGQAEIPLAGGGVTLKQQTRYPWDGLAQITLPGGAPAGFVLRLRIPGWCRQYALGVNGQQVEAPVEAGYAVIRRSWQPGDTVTLELSMPVERMQAHPRVIHDHGRVALQRGPLVYCLESVDNPAGVTQIVVPREGHLDARFDGDLLGGVAVIEGEALARDDGAWERQLYRPLGPQPMHPVILRAIPYYAWDNREAGEMAVWVAAG